MRSRPREAARSGADQHRLLGPAKAVIAGGERAGEAKRIVCRYGEHSRRRGGNERCSRRVGPSQVGLGSRSRVCPVAPRVRCSHSTGVVGALSGRGWRVRVSINRQSARRALRDVQHEREMASVAEPSASVGRWTAKHRLNETIVRAGARADAPQVETEPVRKKMAGDAAIADGRTRGRSVPW